MSDDKVTSLSEFIDCVRAIRQDWNVPPHRELWFRGEAEEYDSLLRPKLYRPLKGGTLRPVTELLEIENQLYEYFQHCGSSLCDTPLEEDYQDWDWYFLMQHHGAPTRLLDWSDGALIALHFALRDKPRDDAKDAVVYVVESYQLQEEIKALQEIEHVKQQWKAYVEKHPSYQRDASEWEGTWLPDDEEGRKELQIPPMPLLLEFPHITRRVAAQRSRFMLFGTDSDWLAEKLKSHYPCLEIIKIKAEVIPAMKVELRESGVTESVVFPDLDGLGREVSQLWLEQL
jgi:FRG domain